METGMLLFSKPLEPETLKDAIQQVLQNPPQDLTERKLRRLLEQKLGYKELELDAEKSQIKEIVESFLSKNKTPVETFPRQSGHCATHLISPQEMKLKNPDEPTRQEFRTALELLQKRNAELVRGDLIEFQAHSGHRNNGIAIFDGEDIIDLDYDFDDEGTVPQNGWFRVIENHVPINYWQHSSKHRGIRHNSFISFDHSRVLTQLEGNLTYSCVDSIHWAVNTWFLFNSDRYDVVFDHVSNMCEVDEDTYKLPSQDEIARVKMAVLELLKSEKPIPFCFQSLADFRMPPLTTLFVTLENEEERKQFETDDDSKKETVLVTKTKPPQMDDQVKAKRKLVDEKKTISKNRVAEQVSSSKKTKEKTQEPKRKMQVNEEEISKKQIEQEEELKQLRLQVQKYESSWKLRQFEFKDERFTRKKFAEHIKKYPKFKPYENCYGAIMLVHLDPPERHRLVGFKIKGDRVFVGVKINEKNHLVNPITPFRLPNRLIEFEDRSLIGDGEPCFDVPKKKKQAPSFLPKTQFKPVKRDSRPNEEKPMITSSSMLIVKKEEKSAPKKPDNVELKVIKQEEEDQELKKKERLALFEKQHQEIKKVIKLKYDASSFQKPLFIVPNILRRSFYFDDQVTVAWSTYQGVFVKFKQSTISYYGFRLRVFGYEKRADSKPAFGFDDCLHGESEKKCSDQENAFQNCGKFEIKIDSLVTNHLGNSISWEENPQLTKHAESWTLLIKLIAGITKDWTSQGFYFVFRQTGTSRLDIAHMESLKSHPQDPQLIDFIGKPVPFGFMPRVYSSALV